MIFLQQKASARYINLSKGKIVEYLKYVSIKNN